MGRGSVSLQAGLTLLGAVIVFGTVAAVWSLAVTRGVEIASDIQYDQMKFINLQVRAQILRFFQSVSRMVPSAQAAVALARRTRPDDPFAALAEQRLFFASLANGIPHFGTVVFGARQPPGYDSPASVCDAEFFALAKDMWTVRTRHTPEHSSPDHFYNVSDPAMGAIRELSGGACGRYGRAAFTWRAQLLPGEPPATGLSGATWNPSATYVAGMALFKVVFPAPSVDPDAFGALAIDVGSVHHTTEIFSAYLRAVRDAARAVDVVIAIFSGSGEVYGTSDSAQKVLIRGSDNAPKGVVMGNDEASVNQPVLTIGQRLLAGYCRTAVGGSNDATLRCKWPRSLSYEESGMVVTGSPIDDPKAAELNFFVVTIVSWSQIQATIDAFILKLGLLAAGIAFVFLPVAAALGRLLAGTVRQLQSCLQAISEMRGLREELAAAEKRANTSGLVVEELHSLRAMLHSVIESLAAYEEFLPAGLAPETELRTSAATWNPLTRFVEPCPPKGDVVIVFTEVSSSAALWEKAPRAMPKALLQHNAAVRDCLALHSGYEVKVVAESFMLAFPALAPAVAFCMAVQERLHALTWPRELLATHECKPSPGWNGLRVKMGLHRGPADAEYNPLTARVDYFGPTVNKTSRLCSHALPGTTAIDEEDLKLLQDADPPIFWKVSLGQQALKGVKRACTVVLLLPITLRHRSVVDASVADGVPAARRAKRLSASRQIAERDLDALMLRSCTVGHVRLAVGAGGQEAVLLQAQAALEAVACACGQTNGVVDYFAGSGIGVSWRQADSAHVAAGLQFVWALHAPLRARASVGVACGKAHFGNVYGGNRGFAAAIGLVVDLAASLSAACEVAGTFALMIGGLAAWQSMRGLVRIVDVWDLDFADGGSADVTEIRPDGGKTCRDYSEVWGWSPAYTDAFRSRDANRIEFQTQDPTLLTVARLLRSGQHLYDEHPSRGLTVGSLFKPVWQRARTQSGQPCQKKQ